MTIQQIKEIQNLINAGGSDISREWITRVTDLIAEVNRLRTEINAIQKAMMKAQY